MKVGITGTRSGMNDSQLAAVFDFLQDADIVEFHHGDCVGVDIEAADIAKYHAIKTVCHPPIKDELRGFHKSDEFREPLSYFARNRKIVDGVDLLLVVPYQNARQETGGTWYTHDYAIKTGVPVKIIYPGEDSA